LALPLLALVLLAAAIHVGWNAVARSIAEKATFAWLTALIGVVVLAPVFLWQRIHDGGSPAPIDARTLRFVALSACLEAAYFLLLQASYRRAELSLVYPLSRGIAPLLVLMPARIWAGESLTAREYVGVAVIVAGVVLVAQSHERGVRRAGGVLFALLTGAAIAAYQLVDGTALRGASAPRPVEFLFLMQVGLATLLTIAFVRTRSPRVAIIEARADWPRLLVAGVAIQASYLMVLFALRDGSIPLVVAARNGAIPLSLLVGRFALKERLTARRIVAALVIVAGVVLLVDWRK
jgi:drug/metabolite transporter (DMT)-like permease